MNSSINMKVLVSEQVFSSLKEWSVDSHFLLPSKAEVEVIVNQTLDNVNKYFKCKPVVVWPYSTRKFSKLISKDITPVFVSSGIFDELRSYLLEMGVPHFDLVVSRGRIPSVTDGFWAGHGVLLGRGLSLKKQLNKLASNLQGRTCFLFDDSLGTGRTLQELTELLESVNIQVSGYVVGSNMMGKDTLAGRPVHAIYEGKNMETIGIEMKDFFDIYGSGAGFPMGAYSQRGLLSRIRSNIKNGKSLDELKECGVELLQKELLSQRLIDVVDFNSLPNSLWLEILKCLKLPGVDFSIASRGRLSYLFPFYHTSYWGLSKKDWLYFSLDQHILSIELYKLIEFYSHKTVRLSDVQVYDELEVQGSLDIVKYLSHLVDLTKQEIKRL